MNVLQMENVVKDIEPFTFRFQRSGDFFSLQQDFRRIYCDLFSC